MLPTGESSLFPPPYAPSLFIVQVGVVATCNFPSCLNFKMEVHKARSWLASGTFSLIYITKIKWAGMSWVCYKEVCFHRGKTVSISFGVSKREAHSDNEVKQSSQQRKSFPGSLGCPQVLCCCHVAVPTLTLISFLPRLKQQKKSAIIEAEPHRTPKLCPGWDARPEMIDI